LDSAVVQKVQFEVEQIDELLNASSPLFDLCSIREPNFVEKCGMALILQSFYNQYKKMKVLKYRASSIRFLVISQNLL
jgi:hypothetical protein